MYSPNETKQLSAIPADDYGFNIVEKARRRVAVELDALANN